MASSQTTDYSQTLKAIKDAEEQTNRELAERRKHLEDQLQKVRQESENEIATARSEAERYIAEQVEKVRASAQQDIQILVESREKEAEKIKSRRLTDSEIRKIIDVKGWPR